MLKSYLRLVSDVANWLLSPVWLSLRQRMKRPEVLYYLYGNGVSDNVKYVLAYHVRNFPEVPATILTEQMTEPIRKLLPLLPPGFNVVPKRKSPWQAVKAVLEASIVVADHAEWSAGGLYWAILDGEILQLWHGVAFKKVGLLVQPYKNPVRQLLARLSLALEQKYTVTWVASTSPFYSKTLFARSFYPVRGIVEFGNQPRNDIFFLSDSEVEEFFGEIYHLGIDYDTLRQVRQWKLEGYRVILLAFTYRKGKYSVYEKHLPFDLLEEMADRLGIRFVVKLHPIEEVFYKYRLGGNYRHVRIYSTGGYSDPQPLLREVDGLVTDYSSMYSDFTLMPHKPIIFFPYDWKEYSEKEQGFQFDYEKFTPGPKVYSTDELWDHIHEMFVKGDDPYYRERVRFSKIAFARHEPVTPDVMKFILSRL